MSKSLVGGEVTILTEHYVYVQRVCQHLHANETYAVKETLNNASAQNILLILI